MSDERTCLRNAIAYICNSFADDPHKLGAIKLNKILWFSDVESLGMRGITISGGLEYTAQDNGPVITTIPSIMRELKDEGIISNNRLDFGDYQQWMYLVLNKSAVETLCQEVTEEERSILDKWINYARNTTVRKIVEKAHDYDWWEKIENGNAVPVHLGVMSERLQQE